VGARRVSVLGVLTGAQMNARAANTVRAAPERVHVAIMRTVRAGREPEFEALIQDFFEEAARQPGVCDAYLIRPIVGSPSRDYGILRSFHSAEDRERFYASDLYRRWNEAVAPLVEGEAQRRELHGLEAFFHGNAPPPPRWKMALLTWVGVNPAVYIFSNAVPAVFGEMPMLGRLLLVNAFVVASLAWVFMPVLTKLFSRWLHPPRA
jgi:antibiotic biosynthesis monooxygenase (ABM) superfamily enzyme